MAWLNAPGIGPPGRAVLTAHNFRRTRISFSLVLMACGAAPAAAPLAASALVAQERVVPGARRRSEWVGALTRLRVALGDDALGDLLREGAATPLEEAMERAESDAFG